MHFSSSSFFTFPVPKVGFQLGAVAVKASGLTLSSLVPHTLLPHLPLGASVPASVLNMTLMQSERLLALLWHPYSALSASGLQSTAIAFHLLSFGPWASNFKPLIPPLPPRPAAAAGMLDCWCCLASRAKRDTVHNCVVRGHHDGNISVPKHHDGDPIAQFHTVSVMAAGEIQLVLVFTNLSSCLLRKAC